MGSFLGVAVVVGWREGDLVSAVVVAVFEGLPSTRDALRCGTGVSGGGCEQGKEK
jgi:hypothetical protein